MESNSITIVDFDFVELMLTNAEIDYDLEEGSIVLNNGVTFEFSEDGSLDFIGTAENYV